MHSLLLALSLLRLFLCSPIYVLLFLVPSLWFPSICVPILPSISLPHLLPQLSLFSASFSYNALFSQKHRSMKTASPQSTLVLLSVFLSMSLFLTLTHTHAHTKHLSMEIEIMIMYPSVCIKVLPLQKNAGRHEMQK